MLKNKKIIIIAGVVALFIFLIIRHYKHHKSISESGVYVIGNIDKTRAAYKGIRTYVSYEYCGEQITSDFVSNEIRMSDRGKRKFIKIHPQYPWKYQIEYEVPVPDYLQFSPYNGWDTLPVVGINSGKYFKFNSCTLKSAYRKTDLLSDLNILKYLIINNDNKDKLLISSYFLVKSQSDTFNVIQLFDRRSSDSVVNKYQRANFWNFSSMRDTCIDFYSEINLAEVIDNRYPVFFGDIFIALD